MRGARCVFVLFNDGVLTTAEKIETVRVPDRCTTVRKTSTTPSLCNVTNVKVRTEHMGVSETHRFISSCL